MSEERLYKMGEVVDKLSWEYSGKISAGTIRFWEKEGLLEPAGKTEGGQRLYTEEHLNWIRFLKELSIAGNSIEEMRKEVERLKGGLEEFKSDPKSRKERVAHFVDVVQTRRRRNALDAELDLFYHRLDGIERGEKIYDTEALVPIIGAKDPRQMIKKAEEYDLVRPKIVNKVKRFSPYELMILKVLVFLQSLEPDVDVVEKCKKLPGTVEYLAKEVGIYEGFPAGREQDGTTGYKATLYNLVLMNLDSLRVFR